MRSDRRPVPGGGKPLGAALATDAIPNKRGVSHPRQHTYKL
jgi:hypothetical protein